MIAHIFPGQGSQFEGMGQDLYESSETAREYFEKANEILGFKITEIMFSGSAEDLKETKVTQPAIFLHSVITALLHPEAQAQAVAGHSLGEFSALVASGALNFEDGLVLVSKRALAMQKACELESSSMAAVLGLEDEVVEKITQEIEEIVVPANYNCPGQLVISGSEKGVQVAMEKLSAAGARRVIQLPVGGAFHSPLMESARLELSEAIEKTNFSKPQVPIYQNVNAEASQDVALIQKNLISQLTAPVRWTQTLQNMIRDGVSEFVEVGPGKVLQGLVKKIDRKMPTSSL